MNINIINMLRFFAFIFLFFFNCFAENQTDINKIIPSISTISQEEAAQPWTNFNLPYFGENLFQGNFDKLNFSGFNPNYAISTEDEIIVHFWGAKSLETTTKVDQQGNIFIPEVGNIKVLNILQKDINDHISKQIKKVYNKNVGVYVQLASSKKVKVFVSGFVKNPGLYEGMASGSIFSYIDSAGGIDFNKGSFRNINVIRNNKIVHTFDLYNFLLNGNIEFIQLHEGDVINIEQQNGLVAVTGKVRNRNRFELKENKILGKAIIQYVNPLDSATNIHIIRTTKEKTENFFLTIDEFKDFEILFEDKIEFFSHTPQETITIIIEGEHDGKQRLIMQENKAKLKDAVASIEVNDRSAINSVILYRESSAERQKQVFNQVLDNLEQKLATYNAISNEDAKIHNEEKASIEEFIKKARNHQPSGMINIYNQKHEIAEIYLEDRDIIHIPKITNLVSTFGYINSPTYTPYTKGKNIKYYIKISGGFSQGADQKTFLVRKLDGSVIQVKAGYKPCDGDEIIILPKISFKIFQFSKDITQILFQMAATARFFVLL